MRRDSGDNLSIYWIFFSLVFFLLFFFFTGYLWVLNGCWKNPPVDFCIGLTWQWPAVHVRDGETSQKPCRSSERHNHHTVDNQIHQILYTYIFLFFLWGRSGQIRHKMAKTCFFFFSFKLPSFQGKTNRKKNHETPPDIQCHSFKTSYFFTHVLITMWENTSMFYCKFCLDIFIIFN